MIARPDPLLRLFVLGFLGVLGGLGGSICGMRAEGWGVKRLSFVSLVSLVV